jgi:hypothetical protein
LKISAALEIPSAGFGYQPSSKLGRFSDPFLFHTWNSAGDYQYSNSLAGDHRIDATNARIDTLMLGIYRSLWDMAKRIDDTNKRIDETNKRIDTLFSELSSIRAELKT